MKKFLLLCVALFFTCNAQAAEIYPLDPQHTNITWHTNHFGFSNPSGKFTKAEGMMVIDQNNPQNSSVQVTIQTDSIQTGIAEFDATLKGKNFLYTEKYPEAKFVSKSVIVQGRNARVVGNFTLLGITNEITMNVRLNKIGLNSYNQRKTAGFSASTIIKRSDFGMDFGAPGISDEVKIDIEVEGILDKNAQIKPQAAADTTLVQNVLFASKTPWRIIPENSLINFTATQYSSTVTGSFKIIEGKVAFDPTKLAESAISLDIDIASLNCSVIDSIPILKQTDWFNLLQFPRANFTATNFEKTPTNSYIAHGNLTIKGHRIPTDVNFYLRDSTDSSVTAVGSAIIKRSFFDIGNQNPDKANGVKDDVQIKFVINAKK